MRAILDNRGVTLISVMAAVAVLAIALTMASSAFISASRLTRSAAQFTTASNFAEGVMEQAKSQPYGSISDRRISRGLPDLPEVACMVDVTPQEPGLKQVSVTCSWVDGKRPRKVTFSTLVAEGGER